MRQINKNEYKNYVSNTLTANSDRLREISGKISSELLPLLSLSLKDFNPNENVIVTTGSDGRLENIPKSSDLELIVYGEDLPNDVSKIIKALFTTELSNLTDTNIHPSIIESHNINKTSLLVYKSDTGDERFFPTRFLDSKFLGGNFEKYKILWNKFIDELKAIKSSDFQKFTKKISAHRKILKKGETKISGKEVKYFDEHKIYLNENGDSIFKMGFLRVYQYSIAKLIFQFIRHNDLTHQDILDLLKMNKTFKEKFDYIADALVDKKTYNRLYNDIINSYYYFLDLHNYYKSEYKKNKINNIELSHEDWSIIQDQIKLIESNIANWKIKKTNKTGL